MPNPPAVCAVWGQPSSPLISFSGGAGNSLIDMGANCPKCGGPARVLDGIYDTLGDTMRILVDTNRSAKEIQAIINALKEAQLKQASAEEVKKTIEQKAPELSGVLSKLPRTRVETLRASW